MEHSYPRKIGACIMPPSWSSGKTAMLARKEHQKLVPNTGHPPGTVTMPALPAVNVFVYAVFCLNSSGWIDADARKPIGRIVMHRALCRIS